MSAARNGAITTISMLPIIAVTPAHSAKSRHKAFWWSARHRSINQHKSGTAKQSENIRRGLTSHQAVPYAQPINPAVYPKENALPRAMGNRSQRWDRKTAKADKRKGKKSTNSRFKIDTWREAAARIRDTEAGSAWPAKDAPKNNPAHQHRQKAVVTAQGILRLQGSAMDDFISKNSPLRNTGENGSASWRISRRRTRTPQIHCTNTILQKAPNFKSI